MEKVHCGIHPTLEAAANEIIFGSIKGVTSQQEKSDILTPWKEQDRKNREVLTSGGTPDAMIRRGMYHRAANKTKPQLNSREGIAPPLRYLSTTPGMSYSTGHSSEDD